MENLFKLTYILPVYITEKDNQDFANLMKTYENYHYDLRSRIQFVLVDDCSPLPISISGYSLNIDLYRIKTDINWNQGGARNLGVTMAKSNEIIVSDTDHLFSEDLLNYLIKKNSKGKIYIFNRIRNGKKTHRHPNTFFLSKSTYFKSLGVDEEFCGNYGYEDIFFNKLQKKLGTSYRKVRRNPLHAIDNKQHNLIRDTSINKELLDRKVRLLNSKFYWQSHSRTFLNFEWYLVEKQRINKA